MLSRSGRVRVGFPLQPEQRYLGLLDAVLREEPDYYVVAPETMWRSAEDAFLPNGYHDVFARLGEETGKTFVAHGVGFSLGKCWQCNCGKHDQDGEKLCFHRAAFF